MGLPHQIVVIDKQKLTTIDVDPHRNSDVGHRADRLNSVAARQWIRDATLLIAGPDEPYKGETGLCWLFSSTC